MKKNKILQYGLAWGCFFSAPLFLIAQEKPNILWIVCEDISPTLSVYGDATAHTPNLDSLATESRVYQHAFAPVGVCAPTRSSIITGMYPTSIGTMHMRTGKDVMSWGRRVYKDKIPVVDIKGDSIREYAAVVPSEVKCFTEYLRAAGYYCTNNQKTDYQFAAPLAAWDQNGKKAHWRNRPQGSPFFSVFNIGLTHESRLWLHEDLPLTVSPDQVVVPPYLPDDSISRRDVARHYSNVALMDEELGRIIRQLKADGLYDQTIIFFYSDHGGPLPRQKREVYDSGLRIPLLIKGIKSTEVGTDDQMVSLTDLGPTVLSLAGVVPPAYMDGKAFLGKYETDPRSYIFGSSDRFDEYTDRSRIIRTDSFLYIRNYFPELSSYKDINYRKQIPMMSSVLALHKQGKLNAVQEKWFESKAKEELYDCYKDPYNLINLAENPAFEHTLERMRTIFLEHSSQFPDLGQLPEAVLIDLMWPDGKQPKTAIPEIITDDKYITIQCSTAGASISWLISERGDITPDLDSAWKCYSNPILPQKGKYLFVVAERIGYQSSELSRIKMD